MGKNKKGRRRSPAAGEFLFDIDPEPLEEQLTALGGVPLLVRACRSLDVPGSVQRHLRFKQRQRGLDEAAYVESFVVLNAVGGENLEDFERLAEDPGLESMLGYELPSPEAARNFLYWFHDEAKLEQAQRELGIGESSYVPAESAGLEGLGRVNRDVVRELGRRCASEKIATVDLDATIIESHKREAKVSYQGQPGYQPLLALWAELNVVLADEFRDGNVPAQQEPLRVARRAFEALPETVTERYFRGDAACYDKQLLDWLRDEQREGGPSGFLGFAVSVRMHAALKEAIRQTPEHWWELYRDDAEAKLECAPILYNPEEKEKTEREPLSYVAIRVRPKQQSLFADGSAEKCFAVVTNLRQWPVNKLLQWHRGKAGTIEALHDVLKNELAGGVLPCGRFGANAAWLRLALLTHNVLTALKRLALPAELLTARPKRLRFLIFHTPGKMIRHARRQILRLARAWKRFGNWQGALRLLPLPT
jgi:hypothetical protein